MDAEKYNSGGRCDVPYFFSGFKSIHSRHTQIQKHNVRGKLRDHANCFHTIFGFAADLERTTIGKQLSHTTPDDFMVIHD